MSSPRPRAAPACSGEAATSAGWTVTGRRFANRPRSAAQGEQRLLGADGRVGVVPLRAPDGAQEDGVGIAAGLDVLGADGDAVRVDAAPPTSSSCQSNPKPKRRPAASRTRRRRVDDLGADPVAGDQRDPVGECRLAGASAVPRRASVTGGPRPVRRRDERHLDAVDLGAVELVGRHEVRLERRLDDVRGQAVSGDDERARALVGRAAAADQDLALRVLAARDGLDLVLGEDREPAEDRPDRLVHGLEQRVDGAVAGGVARLASPATTSETVPTECPPDEELMLQPSSSMERGTSDVRCSTSASRSASVTSFLASARAIAAR